MDVPDAFTPGQRVAWFRHQRGLTQRELAQLVDRDLSWVSVIERGVEELGRIPVILRLAEIFGVTPVDIDPRLGQYQQTRRPNPAADRLARMLATVPGVLAFFTDHPAPDLPTLLEARQQVERLRQLRRSGQYEELSQQLVRLIPLIGAADHGQPNSEWTTLRTELYDLAAWALAELDHPAAAWVAMDRGMFLTDDPRHQPDYSLALMLRTATLHAQLGRLDWGVATADNVLTAGAAFVEQGRAPHVILAGAAHLAAAVWLTELGNPEASNSHLETADQLAGQFPGGSIHGFSFGVSLVALARVTVAVSAGDPDAALAAAEALDPAVLPTNEARAALAIQVALAHIARRDYEQSLEALVQANRLDPYTTMTAHVARRAIVECAALRPQASRFPAALRELLDGIRKDRS